jgi:hypothetical protein
MPIEVTRLVRLPTKRGNAESRGLRDLIEASSRAGGLYLAARVVCSHFGATS